MEIYLTGRNSRVQLRFSSKDNFRVMLINKFNSRALLARMVMLFNGNCMLSYVYTAVIVEEKFNM